MTAPAEEIRVLDVGQCDFDHGNISRMLSRHFAAVTDRAHTVEETVAALGSRRYRLVLVNRVFDRDGDEGIRLIQRLQDGPAASGSCPPVMLVSNYADAQERAVQAGALRGFGKAALESPDTLRALEGVLRPTRAGTTTPAS